MPPSADESTQQLSVGALLIACARLVHPDHVMAARASYDKFKEFGGKRYTGMAVGRSHKWRYDAGEWKERKVTPDRWEFSYSVVKRRAGRAPEGSGAPVGTAYHWYIVADQVVTKLDANSYSTEMVGHKLKVSHKRADKTSWAASERAKREHLVKLLRELADELEAKPDAELESKPGDERPGGDAAANREARRSGHARRTPRRKASQHSTTPRRSRGTSHAPSSTARADRRARGTAARAARGSGAGRTTRRAANRR